MTRTILRSLFNRLGNTAAKWAACLLAIACASGARGAGASLTSSGATMTPVDFRDAIAEAVTAASAEPSVVYDGQGVTIDFANAEIAPAMSHQSDGLQFYILGDQNSSPAKPVTVKNVKFSLTPGTYSYNGKAYTTIQLYLYAKDDVSFENCVFANVGLSMNGATNPAARGYFTDCTFENVDGYGLKYFRNLVATRCLFDGCKRAMFPSCSSLDASDGTYKAYGTSTIIKIDGCRFVKITKDRIIKFYNLFTDANTTLEIINNVVDPSSTASFITCDFDNGLTPADYPYTFTFTGNTGVTSANLNESGTEKTLYISGNALVDVEPVAAVAQIVGGEKYETLAEAIAAVPTTGAETTITMTADSAEPAVITVASGKNVVLDLNGKTVSYTTDAKSVYFITNEGTLTIKDNSANAEGMILLTAQADNGYSVENVTLLNEGGALTLESGMVKNLTPGGLTYAVKNSSNAWASNVVSTFNMTGGIISAPQGDGALRVYQNTGVGWKVQSKNYVNISGGTILDTGIFFDTYLYTVNQTLPADFAANDTAVGCDIDTVVNISGGTINGLIDMKIRHPYNTRLNITGGDFANCKMWVRKVSNEYGSGLASGTLSEPTESMVYISGGKFAFVAGKAFGLSYDCGATSWTSYAKPYAVSGGVFNVEVPENACVAGKTSIANTETETKDAYPYTVGVAVAQIGTKGYATLPDAIAAAQNGDTVKLLADVDMRSSFASASARFPISKSLTIDGQNHSITVGGRGFGVGMNASSKIDVTFKDVMIANSSAGARCIDTRGNLNSLTLDHATLDTNDATSGYTQPLTIGGSQSDKATVSIVNGSKIQTNDEGTAYYAIITFNPVNMTIDDSTIKGWACIYAKGPDGSAGSAGSVFTITDSELVSKNEYSGTSNAFAMLMAEDDNVTFNVTNTKIDVNATGDQHQAIVATGSSSQATGVAANLGEGNEVTLSGEATFEGHAGSAVVSGGTFNVAVPEEICADGYIPAAQDPDTGKYTVKTGSYVAQNATTGVKYETLQEVINAASAGDTVKLLADVDMRSSFASASARFPISKSLTIDGQNHSITVGGRGFGVGMNASSKIDVTFKDVTIANSSAGARCIDTRGNLNSLTLDHATLDTNGATSGYTQPLTIGGNQSDAATVSIVNGSKIQTNDEGTAYYAIITFNPVNMTIDDSTIKGWACIYAKGPDGSAGSEGSVFTITDSELVSKNVYSGETNAFAMLMAEDDDVTFNVTNTKIDVNATGDQSQAIVSTGSGSQATGVAANLGAGNEVTLSGEATFEGNTGSAIVSGGTFNVAVPEEVCADGYIPAAQDPDTGKYTVKTGSYVAQNATTGVKYETLQEAINAASAGDTVQLLADVDLEGGSVTINKGITLDGKEYSLVTSASGAIKIQQTTAAVTIKNLDILQAQRGMSINPNKGEFHVTVSNVTMLVSQRGITFDAGGAAGSELNVVDCEFKLLNTGSGTESAYINGEHYRGISAWDSPGATFNITDCKIDGFAYDINVAGDHGSSTFNIAHSEFSGRAMLNVWSSGNTFNVTDCEINGYNTQTGPTERFGSIVANNGSSVANNNIFNINQCRFTANLSQAASSEGGNASQQMFAIRGYNSTVTIRGNTVSYEAFIGTDTAEPTGRFGLEEFESHIHGNTFYLDTAATNDLAAVLAELTTVVPVAVTEGVDGAPVTGVKLVKAVASVDFLDGEAPSLFATFADAIAAADAAGVDEIAILDGTTTSPDSNWKVENGLLVRKVYVAQIGTTKYATLAEAVAAVPADGTETTIQMIADSVEAAETAMTIASTQNVVIDLAGHTVSGTFAESKTAERDFIKNHGTLTVKDSSAAGTGKITMTTADSDNSYGRQNVTIYNEGGTFTLEGGCIENLSGYCAYAIVNSSNSWDQYIVSTFNMTGGSVSCPNGDQALRVYQNCAATQNENYTCQNYVNISGGTIVDTGIWLDGFLYTTGWDLTSYTGENIKTVVDISGGTINGLFDYSVRHPYNTEVKISGGTFTECRIRVRTDYTDGLEDDASPAFAISGGKFAFAANGGLTLGSGTAHHNVPYLLTGGYFSTPVAEEYCANGYLCTTVPVLDDLYQVVASKTVTFSNTDKDVAGFVCAAVAYPSGNPAETTLPTPTYTAEGKTFAGWKVKDSDPEVILSAIPAGATENYTLVATWASAQVVSVTEDAKTATIKVTDAWVEANVKPTGDAATTEEIKEALEETDTNGLKKWENYVLGQSPKASLSADAKQGSISAMPVTSSAQTPKVDTGFKVQYRLDKVTAGGDTVSDADKGTAQDSDVIPLDLTEMEGSVAYYKTTAIITSTDDNSGVSVEVPSENTIGVLKVTSTAKTTPVAVPWESLAADGQDITVSDLVRTATLSEGDELKVYDTATGKYRAWTLNGSKEWKPIPVVGGASSEEAGDSTIARGSGVWLTRTDTTKPIYLVGEVAAEKAEVKLEAGSTDAPSWNLVGSTTVEPVSVTALLGAEGNGDGDKIVVPTAYVPKEYVYVGGKWGYYDSVVDEKTIPGLKLVKQVFVPADGDDDKIPAGTGFWYLNGKTSDKTIEL